MHKALNLTDEELRRLQLTQTEMLHEIHRICVKNNIKYVMDAGTLLGAVRHGKFIPWDDDIDIRILRSEYKKLCKALEKDLDKEKYFFQNYESDEHYLWQYSRILKKGTRYVRLGKEHLKQKDGVYLDIFICDGVPENEKIRKVHNAITTFCRKSMYAKVAYLTEKDKKKKMSYNILRFIPKSFTFFIYNSLGKIFDEQKCKKVGSYGWHDAKDNNGFNRKWFTDVTLLAFEDGKFYAPRDYDGFLRYSFGDDYMQLPPEEQRFAKAFTSYYKF